MILRKTIKSKQINELIKFHTRNKYLLQAYNEKLMRKMGKLTANPDKFSISEIINQYKNYLTKALKKPPKYKTWINILNHSFGFFSNQLSTKEKQFFLDIIEKYRNNKVPRSVPLNILKTWVIKYEQKFLKKQTFFNPFPEDLIDIKDSGKGR